MGAPTPFNEIQRLQVLAGHGSPDRQRDAALDRLARLAARHFAAPVAFIALVGESKVWIVGRHGFDHLELERADSPCAHAILSDRPLVVPDASRDPRFRDNLLVTGPDRMRFYAGAALADARGFKLGTLCILDDKPRAPLEAEELEALAGFAELAMTALESRRLQRRAEPGASDEEIDPDALAEAQFAAFSNLAHEVRTPLNAIMGFAESMRMGIFGEIGNERYRQYLDHICSVSRHLVDLSQKTLDFASLRAGEVPLEEEVLDLGELFATVRNSLTPLCGRSGVRLRLSLPDAEKRPRLQADRTRAVQMLVNLVTNAVRASRFGDLVYLRARGGPDGSLEIQVCDRGEGMTEAELRQALQPFGRALATGQSSQEGFGLGLPLTRRLIRVHGGELLVRSVKGHGTVASLRFPRYRVLSPLPLSAEPATAEEPLGPLPDPKTRPLRPAAL